MTRKAVNIEVHLLSDSSGNLLEHFFSAILTQFPNSAFRMNSVPFIINRQKLLEVIQSIDSGIVCHAIADPDLKKSIASECASRGLPQIDVTGPTVTFLEKISGIEAANSPKALHPIDANYMGRMAALEFAMQHDDNRRIDRLDKADVILVGVSRVSKSPNALFLAYRGYRVANVAVVPSEGLPAPLAEHQRGNVVALTIQPKRLSEIRQRRFSDWDLEKFDYSDIRAVIEEVRAAEDLYTAKGWSIIDTTDLAVEETSTLILKALDLPPAKTQQ